MRRCHVTRRLAQTWDHELGATAKVRSAWARPRHGSKAGRDASGGRPCRGSEQARARARQRQIQTQRQVGMAAGWVDLIASWEGVDDRFTWRGAWERGPCKQPGREGS